MATNEPATQLRQPLLGDKTGKSGTNARGSGKSGAAASGKLGAGKPGKLAASMSGGLIPLPAGRKGGRKWRVILTLLPIVLMALAYLAGRSIEPVRQQLIRIPLVGRTLFAGPVWPVLWNKPAAVPDSAGGQTVGTASPALNDLQNQIAARLAAVELREKALAEAEEVVALEQAAQEEQASDLAEQVHLATELRATLEGQLRTELDRLAVIRDMRLSAAVAVLGEMTDGEVLRLLRHMGPDEAARYLGEMEPERSARLLLQIGQVAEP